MIIYRVCTESNEDGSAFGAKIEAWNRRVDNG